MKTAKEFFNSYSLEEYDEGGYLGLDDDIGAKMLIEFAKMHLEAAKIEISEKATCMDEDPFYSSMIDKNSILDTYPPENIV